MLTTPTGRRRPIRTTRPTGSQSSRTKKDRNTVLLSTFKGSGDEMQVEGTTNGFVSIIENGIIDRIVCTYHENCTVYFHNQPPRVLNICCSSYNFQYGIPVAEDGKTLFVSSWEDGLDAYDISSGSLRWRFKSKKITSIAVYPAYLVAQKMGEALVKIDITNGDVLASLRSGTIQKQFELIDSYLLVDSVRGKLSIVDTEQMRVVRQYGKNVVNPAKCLSMLIRNGTLQNGVITIQGLEQYPNGHCTASEPKPFSRVIDTDFSSHLPHM